MGLSGGDDNSHMVRASRLVPVELPRAQQGSARVLTASHSNLSLTLALTLALTLILALALALILNLNLTLTLACSGIGRADVPLGTG